MSALTAVSLRELLYKPEDDYVAELDTAVDAALPWIRFLAEVMKRAAGPWSLDAACKGHDMFPERGRSQEPGFALCRRCVVRYECEQWAEEYGPTLQGIAAGESQKGRRERRKALRVPVSVVSDGDHPVELIA